VSTNISVKKVPDATQRTEPVFAAVDALLESIRSRAYELCAQRDFKDGSALDDWFKAEREISWPTAELVEDEKGYQLKVALPGYSAREIEVTVTPQEIIIGAASAQQASGKQPEAGKGVVRWSEFRSNQVCRRVELPSAIDTNQVSAALDDGLLTVKAAKSAQVQAQSAPVAAAA
jgi:HSP20 family protein